MAANVGGMRKASAVSPTAQAVAEEVRAWMGRKQLRGADLSRELGISQPQVSYRVRGELAWSLDELDTLAQVFGCDVADLLPARASTRAKLHRDAWGLAA